MKTTYIILLFLLLLLVGCSKPVQESVSRYSKIPASAVKMTPETDISPVKSFSSDFADPVPIATIDSAGAEDSAFIMPDGKTLYFFYTPDVNVPIEKQIIDGATGIYVSQRTRTGWGEPERVMLQDKGKVAGDGCEFVQGNIMWFCSVREGYTGIHWFTAEYKDGRWQSWKNADFNQDYKVGELHINSDGNELYFHSDRPGGKGGLDIWVSEMVDGVWQEPENVAAVNTNRSEGWPAISPDNKELWISRDYGLWRSKKVDNNWSEPVLMFSPLAGEASIDNQGNVYFTHHFYRDDKMIEADIYVAHRK